MQKGNLMVVSTLEDMVNLHNIAMTNVYTDIKKSASKNKKTANLALLTCISCIYAIKKIKDLSDDVDRLKEKVITLEDSLN